MKVETFRIRIGTGRRIVLPNEVCALLSLAVGDTMIVRVESDHATLSSGDRTVERFQSMLADRVPVGYSAVDELIAEREDANLLE